MCLILFALNAHPDYPFVLAANRDEFTKRPAHKAHWWSYFPDVFGGIDLEAGGTWLGITRQGRFTALTNVRDLSNINPDAPSRGELTYKFLTQNPTNGDFATLLERRKTMYNGFNILWGNIAAQEIFWFSNYGNVANGNAAERISTGVHGLSNALLDTPWYKVEEGKQRLQSSLTLDAEEKTRNPKTLTETLLAMLQDPTRPDDSLLPDTGVGIEWERQLSSLFIHAPERSYGTRCSTVILLDNTNTVHFTESRFTPSFEYGVVDETLGKTQISFRLV
jgi:uncharacterized protein with NRDE domain